MRTKGALNKSTLQKSISNVISNNTKHIINNNTESEDLMQLSAREIFKNNYRDAKNHLTPIIIKYGKLRKGIAYELSKGNVDIFGKNSYIYAVTITGIDKSFEQLEKYIKLSKSFASENEAIKYVSTLKNHNF